MKPFLEKHGSGRIELTYNYHGFDIKPASEVWTAESMDALVTKVADRLYDIGYDNAKVAELDQIIQAHLPVAGKTVLLLSNSHIPWLEAILLANSAEKVVTIDWWGVEIHHDKVPDLQRHVTVRNDYLRFSFIRFKSFIQQSWSSCMMARKV